MLFCIISLETAFPDMLNGYFDSEKVLSRLHRLSWYSMFLQRMNLMPINSRGLVSRLIISILTTDKQARLSELYV